MTQVYIQTNKFYTIPTYKDYFLSKNAYLKTIDNQYQTKKTSEKWTLLIEQLAKSLSQEHMPNNYQLEKFKTALTKFKLEREGTFSNYFNLSLTQCVNYFEEFNFLYGTTEPRYKLTNAAKKDLIKSIHEAMPVCETGLNSQLYSALQVHRKDSSWIQDELTKARCETLRMLQDAYGGIDVHVYNKLVEFANKAELGLPQKEELYDVHAGMVDSARLKTLFNKHYPALYEAYEKEAKDTLTNLYISVLADTLAINNVEWDAGTIKLSLEKTKVISDSIGTYFQGIPTDIYQLGELSDDCGSYILKSKPCVTKIIKGLVTQKLIYEAYFVTLEQIAEDPSAYPDYRLKRGLVLDELIGLDQALKKNEPELIQEMIQANPLILINYPELVISKIKSNPAILSSVPQWLRTDKRFIDSAMMVLNQLLSEAISNNCEEEIHNVTSQILSLIQSEYAYFQHLSDPVFKNPVVGELLVNKEPLLFGYLDLSLQNNLTLRTQAERKSQINTLHSNPAETSWYDITLNAYFIARQNLPSSYKNEPGLKAINKHIPYSQAMTNFLRIKSVSALLKPDILSKSAFIEHANNLNPYLLHKIINDRKTKGFPPLPFFDNDKICLELEKFNREIQIELTPDWSLEYLFIKEKACQQENFNFMRNSFSIQNSVTYMAKTDNWFSAFNQYHVYQSSNEHLRARLMLMLRALYDFILPIIKIALALAAICYIYPLLYLFTNIYIIQGLLTHLALTLLNMYLKNPRVEVISAVILFLVMLDSLLLLQSITIICHQICNIVPPLLHVAEHGASLMRGLFVNTLSYFISKKEALLEDVCENILLRLEGINESSAQGKREVLRDLLIQIKAEVSLEECSFKALLDKKYSVSYQGQTHNVSFSEVSSKRRAHKGEFKLETQTNRLYFFSPKTTTETLLENVEGLTP